MLPNPIPPPPLPAGLPLGLPAIGLTGVIGVVISIILSGTAFIPSI